MKIKLLILLLVISCNKDGGQELNTGVPDSTIPEIEQGNQLPTTPISNWTEEFMTLVNNHRRDKGLRALIHEEELGEIAQSHAQDMAIGKTPFGHSGFSSRCNKARDILGGGNHCSENVAVGQKSPEEVFNSWIKSSGHRANIEQVRSTHTGLGYAKNSSGKYYWTQIFLER